MEARQQLLGDLLPTAGCTLYKRSTTKLFQGQSESDQVGEASLTESIISTWMPSLFRCCRKTVGRGLTDFPVPISNISGKQKRNGIISLSASYGLADSEETHQVLGQPHQRPRIYFRPIPSKVLAGHPREEPLLQGRCTQKVIIFRPAAAHLQL